MSNPAITAVGRLLKPKGNEPRIHRIIKVKAGGTAKTVVNRPI